MEPVKVYIVGFLVVFFFFFLAWFGFAVIVAFSVALMGHSSSPVPEL